MVVGWGFRYLRRAGEGGSSDGGGRLSSVNSGAKEKIERVRKSSGLLVGVVAARLDTVWAADLRARSEAVRFERRDEVRLFWVGRIGDGDGRTMVSSYIGDKGSSTFTCWRG